MKINTENPAFSYVSLDVKIAGDTYNPKSLKYGDNVERGMVQGNHPVAYSMTRGTYKADSATFEFFMEDFITLQKKLGKKFYTTTFQAVASYAEDGRDTVTDTLVGCRFKKRQADNSQGNDALMRSVEADVHYIKWNGDDPFEKMPK